MNSYIQINELTEKLRRLKITDSIGIPFEFDQNYVCIDSQKDSTSKKNSISKIYKK